MSEERARKPLKGLVMTDYRRFSLDTKPHALSPYIKKTQTQMIFLTIPFEVDTQEGVWVISPETVDDWDGVLAVLSD